MTDALNQGGPSKNPNLAHWTALKNGKEDVDFWLLIVFSYVLQFFLLFKTSTIAFSAMILGWTNLNFPVR